MKPLNRQEKLTAFYQFILLFLLTSAVLVVAIYFDYGIEKKDYQLLKQKVQTLSNSQVDYDELFALLDSIQTKINVLDKVDEGEYNGADYVIRTKLLSHLDKSDTTNFSKLEQRVKALCEYWMADKNRLRKVADMQAQLETQKQDIKSLKEALLRSGFQPEDVNALMK